MGTSLPLQSQKVLYIFSTISLTCLRMVRVGWSLALEVKLWRFSDARYHVSQTSEQEDVFLLSSF
ncbi:hypothetical protein DY000_02026649 [Brassica cretica]|uniref:Uncharacterized protein n=1 Tax=Brassica cretica TaxID=69181 RepID=A0ABQ7ELW2_BRACR|nr:hypothetical protein DY000_02026649 [Brassica cretica]